jgi:hypothetical protein
VESSWSPYYYVLIGFRYGYADNLPNFTDNADTNSWNYEGCGIDIAWAVDENRQPVSLDFIDFVRVYTGLNQKCPQQEWWGETSTEFAGAEDMHLQESLDAIRKATGINELTMGQTHYEIYDLQGRRVKTPGKGIYIKNGKKLFIK